MTDLPPPAGSTVWVERVFSPVLAVLAFAALVAGRLRRHGKGANRQTYKLVALAPAVLVLGTLRVVVNADGLAVGFGPWGWPERRFSMSRITRATVEKGVSHHASLEHNLVRAALRLVLGIGYRFVPSGTRVVLGFGDILVVHLDNGHTFGLTVPDANRAAELINASVAR